MIKIKSSGRGGTPEREEERKRKISETMKNNPKAGGLRKGSGRGKKGWYKGYWCDSSWELAWVIYHIEHNIKFERNNTAFEYIYNDVKHFYYPDFIINDMYYEVKGRRSYLDLDNISKQKISQFKGNLTVFYSTEMKPILNYVEHKYGKDYVRLYDNSKYIKKSKPKLNTTNKSKRYCDCGVEIGIKNKSGKCRECYKLIRRTVERPPYEQLLKEIKEFGYCGISRKYGVSDTAIRKWIKQYNK